MRTVVLAVALGIAMASAGPARADPVTVLSPGATWNFTFTDPTSDPTWNTTTGVGGIWASGAAPFGNCPAAGCGGFPTDFDANTSWPADDFGDLGDDLWVRTAVTVPSNLDRLYWNLGADNGFTLFVNGNLVAADNAEGYTFRWEYSGGIPRSFFHPGENVVALALEDHGGLTAFDMEIASPTPEPATMVLCAIGLAGVGLRRLRK